VIYIDADTLDQCREALRQGSTLENLAGQLRVDTAKLAELLGLPLLKPIPQDNRRSDLDVFAADRLEGVL
jgi:hypothetical protein